MTTRIGRTVLPARDLDAMAAFYREGFGFRTLHDRAGPPVRLLHIGPGDVGDPGLWLLPAGDFGSDGGGAGARGGGSAWDGGGDRDGLVAGTGDGGSTGAGSSGPVLVLYVDDLDAALTRLERLGVAPHVPASHDAATGDRYAHVHDPERNELILVELGAEAPGGTGAGA